MKKDITYSLSTGDKTILCIDEIFDNGSIIHHNNGVYFLMDEPDNPELKLLVDFSKQCYWYVKDLNKDDSTVIELNGETVEITVKSITEGGLFKEDD